jgi:hypothetical protein
VKKMRTLYRIGGLVGAILLPIGAVLAIGIPEASAASGQQYCYIPQGESGVHACLNAWGGGPWVDVSTNDNTRNNDFTYINNTNNENVELEFTGDGAWSGNCIGDAYNQSGQASTSLDGCGTNGQGAGWGTQFIYITGGCPPGEVSFYNIHWGGYLGPPNGWVNGSHFYLNKPGQYCFLYSNYI